MNRQSRHRIATVVVAVLAAGAIVSVAWHTTAWLAYRESWDATTSGERLASARRAAELEPWNRSHAVRAAWLSGSAELESGDYNAAVETLGRAYRMDVGNPDLLAEFQRAQRIQSLETVKKAHLQHGHEGPGGTLRPEDIER